MTDGQSRSYPIDEENPEQKADERMWVNGVPVNPDGTIALDHIGNVDVSHLLEGPVSDRPASADLPEGARYLATDQDLYYRNTSNGWVVTHGTGTADNPVPEQHVQTASIGDLLNNQGDHRVSSANTVYYDSGRVVALDQFGDRIDSGTHEGTGGVNDDATVIQSALDKAANQSPRGVVTVVPNGAYTLLDTEVHVRQNTTLNLSMAQVFPQNDTNLFYLDKRSRVHAKGTIIGANFVSGYTSDVFVLDTSRTAGTDNDYFYSDGSACFITGYPLVQADQGQGTCLALRASNDRIDAGIFAEIMTDGGENGVLLDASGGYVNANRIMGQFRNANQNVHHIGSYEGQTYITGPMMYGSYGIRNQTTKPSVIFEGQFIDPIDFTTALTSGPGITVRNIRDDYTQTLTSNQRLDAGTSLVDASGGAITTTLPPAAFRTQIRVKKIDSSTNTVTVQQNSTGETIDGSASVSLSNQYDAIEVKSDGSDWFIVSDTR